MMLVIKLIVFIIGCIEGFFGGMEGSVVGGTYDPGLSDTQIKVLKEKSKLFKFADNNIVAFMFLYNPFIIMIIFFICVLIYAFYPRFLQIISDNYINISIIVIVYMASTLIMYFVGMCYCDNLQRKYKIYSIK